MPGGWLVFIPPAIGLFFGLIGLLGGQPEFAAFGWAIIKGSFIAWLVWQAIVFGAEMVFPKVPSKQQYRQYFNPHLVDGWIENNGPTRILHADGYAFEMANVQGFLWWREVDPTTKEPYEDWHSDRPELMAELVKSIVNLRKGTV